MSVEAINSSRQSSVDVVEEEKKIALIQKLAKEILLDIAIAALFVGVALPFMAPAYQMTVLMTTASFLGISILLRGGYGVYMYMQTDKEVMGKKGGLGKVLADGFTNGSFLWFATPRNTLNHEAGHAAAACALYQNARPKVVVEGFSGGYTSWYPQKLTGLGKSLGERASRAVVSGAGPAFGIMTACADIAIAHKIRKSDPNWSFRFNLMAIANIAHHCLYALSAFFITSPGHDFVNLFVYGGVNPLAAIVVMIAIPVIVKLGLELSDQVRNSHKEKHLKEAQGQTV